MHPPSSSTLHVVMAIVVSGAVLAAAIFVVLSHRYDEGAKKWAYGAIGTVVGYWLKM